VNAICNENDKTLVKEIEADPPPIRHTSHVHRLEESILLKCIYYLNWSADLA
jgi:hypothetical protein